MKMRFTKMWRKTFLLVTGLCICCVAHYDAYAEARITDEDAVQRRTVNVKGTVLDANDNAPLIGVSVLEQGTTHGVVTDVNGAYSIDVNPEAVLVFSYMGYVTQSIPVGASSQINVRLETDTQMIDDIVVEIGYGGSQRKQDLSMSITTVKVDDVAKGRTQDLATVLQGQVPGMTVQMTGDPMKEANMNIRGRGSKGKDDDETSGSGVLIVVDGVPNAPYMVEDIETVTVLKDAASAAIYGSQAGQGGVILITTRRAQAGQARVSLNISNGIKKVSNLPEMLTSEQYNTVWRKAIESASANLSDYNFADPSSSVYNWTNVTRTNWLDEIFRLGHTQHYGITVSGGSEKLTAIVSAAYDQEDGVLINTYSKALNARMNIEYRITDWLKFSQRANFQTRNGQGDVSTGHQGPIMSALWMPRSATVYETDVNGKLVYDLNGNKKYGGLYPATLNIPQYPKNVMNPVAELTEMRRRYPSTKLYSTSVIEVKPISTLTINSSFTGYMYHHDKDESLPIRKETGSYERKEISREQEFNKDKGWLWESVANYANVFGKHHISAMAGYTMKYDFRHFYELSTSGYKSMQENQFLWDQMTDRTGQALSETKDIFAQTSLIGRIGYSYDDRYFLTASIRYDGSSTLRSDNRYEAFPAVSGSWKISSERFMEGITSGGAVNLVKLRGSWGRIGDINGLISHGASYAPATEDYYAIFGPDSSREIYGTSYRSLANPNLRWEYTDQWGLGLDLTFLRNRLDITVDYYNKTTNRLIAPMPIPDMMGIPTAPMDNIGTVNNKGWEFSVNFSDRTKSGLGYSVWGMLNTNKSEVTDLGLYKDVLMNNSINVNSTQLLASQVGSPLYSFYLYQTDGIFKSQDEIDNYVNAKGDKLQSKAKPGDVKYVDVDGNGSIGSSDRVLQYNYQPKMTFSFGGTVDFRGFDLSLMFQGVAGNHIYNGLKQLLSSGRYEGGNLSTAVLDSYDFGGNYPALTLIKDDNGNFSRMSDIFLEKGDYLRLKNLTLGYTLPKSAMRAIGLSRSSLRVYFSADNLLTFTKYSGIDPEVGNFGVDRGSYPVSRIFNFGLNINF